MISRSQGFIWLTLQLSIAAAGAVGALFDPVAGLASGVLLVLLNFFTLKKGWDARHQPEDNKSLADTLAASGLMLFLLLLFTHTLMNALGALLIATTLALNVQLNNYRKYYLLQLVSFVLLLVGAAEATSGSYLVIMTLYCVFASFSLSEAWLDRGADSAALTGPAFSQRLNMGLLTMGLAVVIYLFIPRLPALDWGAQDSGGDFYHNQEWLQNADNQVLQSDKKPSAPENSSQQQYRDLQQITELSDFDDNSYRYDGFNESFDITTTDRRGQVDLDAIVARMKASHGTYLKVRTFDTFDGSRWSTANEDISRKVETASAGLVVLNNRQAQRDDLYIQTIMIEQPMPAWLAVSPDPVKLWVPSSVIALDQFAQPLMPATLSPGTRYSVASTNELIDNRLISHAPAPDAADLQLPKGFDKRIRRLAYEVTAMGRNPYQQAQLLEQHLRSEYQYDFDSILLSQGHTPLSEFLFKTKKGHCEYFASAMTVMLRSMKIPARLVTGFSVTTQNPLTGYFEIRAIDGHAWTEAWLDGRWVTFEPTAYYNFPEQQQSPLAAEQISQYAEDLLRRHQNSGAQEITLMGVLSSLWLLLYTAVIVALAWLRLLVQTLWPVLLVSAVLPLVAWFSRHLWLARLQAYISRWQLQRYQPADAHKALQFYTYHLQRIAAQKAPLRQRQQTLAEWLPLLLQHWPVEAEAQAFAELATSVLYRSEVVAPQALRQAALDLQAKMN